MTKLMPLSFRILTFIFLLFPMISWTQTSVKVVTKKIEKTFNYRSGIEVNIEGEKAEVNIETWDKANIQVVLEIIAKHPEQQVAEKDLERVRYLADRVKNKIYLRNYISNEEKQGTPESSLSARYTITLPEDCPVYLKNNFGLANISNLSNHLRINSQFTKMNLTNIQGELDIRTRFGDLIGNGIDGNVSINSRRSNLYLNEIKGTFNIQAHYGVLEIFADNNLLDLNLDANKSDVFLYSPDPGIFSYDLTAQSSDLILPNSLGFKFEDNTPNLTKANFKPKQEVYANIAITIQLGSLKVEKKKSKNF